MKKVYKIALHVAAFRSILCPPTRTHNMTINLKSIKTVSEYIAKGGLQIGALLESPVKETEKALAFPTVKHNRCANPYETQAWLPKSQLVEIENDFYTNNAPEKMYLCPTWLYAKNFRNGESLASA